MLSLSGLQDEENIAFMCFITPPLLSSLNQNFGINISKLHIFLKNG